MKLRLTTLISIISIIFLIMNSSQARPEFNGSTPGCGSSGCHNFQDNMVSASVNGYNISIIVGGTTGNVAGELVNDLNAVVTYNNGTSQNPFTLTAPGPGVYIINAGHKSPQVWDSVKVYLVPPAAPGDLTALVNLSAPSVALNWSDNSSDESGFVIERQVEGTGTFEIVDTVGPGSTTYTDTAVTFITYNYRLKAYNFYGSSAYSPLAQAIIPVELTSFSAANIGNQILLLWQTATEKNNFGFSVERKLKAEQEWQIIGFVGGKGTTTEVTNYTFTDKLIKAGIYNYRLKQMDFNGSYEYSQEVQVEVVSPTIFSLEQNYPNPFNPATTIGFNIAEKSNVRLTVLNLIGEEAAVMVDEEKDAGYHTVEFNAANLPSGVYFYQIKAGDFVQTKKMILMK